MQFENYVGGMAIGIRSQTHGIVLVISESRSRCYRILRSSAMHNFWVIFVIDIVEKPTSSVVSRSMNFFRFSFVYRLNCRFLLNKFALLC